MTDHAHDNERAGDGVSRRKILECMTWAGTGVLWTISGGVPRSLGIIDEAMAQDAGGLTFLQISDSGTASTPTACISSAWSTSST
jgi:hypothetical protein